MGQYLHDFAGSWQFGFTEHLRRDDLNSATETNPQLWEVWVHLYRQVTGIYLTHRSTTAECGERNGDILGSTGVNKVRRIDWLVTTWRLAAHRGCLDFSL
ncbi:hypothetical protein AWC31_14415 [Mycolicibacterium wolinskyi]|uniref:Uncharacterized protein n=1 Tax=Mycolicibacterium wolinskyi TaxID=59750 RepID=A0A1X2FJ95_9MYCO|nr:hypothetical protein AWC31_14415 [Mycolicibacterium wolinskyi]